MAPSSLRSRPRPPGGLRPALTPPPGDAHQQRPGAGSHNFKPLRFEGIATRSGRARMCVEITSRERPWAAPPLSSKARMKAVGTNPLARYVGQETGARPPPTPAAHPPNTHTQPAGEPGEPITHDHNQET